MTGRVVFEGRARVDYRQMLVETGEQVAQFDHAFEGQTNGLLGAGVPGALVLVAGHEVRIHGLMGDHVSTFELPVAAYRVRWSGRGIDDAYDGVVRHDEPLVDTFELALWPADPAPEEIVRRASRRGREAHQGRTADAAASGDAVRAACTERAEE